MSFSYNFLTPTLTVKPGGYAAASCEKQTVRDKVNPRNERSPNLHILGSGVGPKQATGPHKAPQVTQGKLTKFIFGN